jgi:hypothetical protein
MQLGVVYFVGYFCRNIFYCYLIKFLSVQTQYTARPASHLDSPLTVTVPLLGILTYPQVSGSGYRSHLDMKFILYIRNEWLQHNVLFYVEFGSRERDVNRCTDRLNFGTNVKFLLLGFWFRVSWMTKAPWVEATERGTLSTYLERGLAPATRNEGWPLVCNSWRFEGPVDFILKEVMR